MAKSKRLSDKDIEGLYDSAEFRLSQERSDFLLPQIQDFVREKRWINLRPEYQRRLVWDNKKKSLLIESLLMNVPIPPVFLYEHDLSRYEVMDGQQRLNTIVEFYENRLKLRGLEKWQPLNGRTYAECPPRIQRGLDRRRVSATVLLVESTTSPSSTNDLRRLVFERLNTGGRNLNNQELRNCLYSGPFNDLIIELAGCRLFDEIWDIPPYDDNIRGDHISKPLLENNLYRRMRDCEIVLRFFAFRKKAKLRGSVRRILDNCMIENELAGETDIQEFRDAFLARLELAFRIFGRETFRIDKKLSIPLYDAIMVALDRLHKHERELTKHATTIRRRLKEMLKDREQHAVIVARANTAEAIKERQDTIENLFSEFV